MKETVLPAMTRSDAGTENGLLAICQMFLRQNCSDNLAGNKSYVYGSSMGNQVMVNQILNSCVNLYLLE